MRRLRDEPMVHFVVLGLALFALHAAVKARPHRSRIVLSPQFLAGLRADALERTGHAPTPAEEAALVERFLDEETLYREAVALGLDRGDVIIRRRLVQKMEFLTRDTSPAGEPGDRELQRLLDAHRARYDAPPRVSFRHLFVADRAGAEAECARLRDRLDAGEPPARLGDPFVQGATWTRRSEKELAAVFGGELARGVMALPAGAWSPPLRSRFGFHLVRVDERVPPVAATVGELRARLREDWLAERRAEIDRQALAELRARYGVERPAQ